MKIPYLLALGLVSLYMCALNFIFFQRVLQGLANTQNPAFLGAILFFSAFLIFFSGLFLLAPPRIFKAMSAVLIAIAAISAYFMNSFGVYLDSDMLANALDTDTKEAFSYVNLKFILWILFLVVLPITLIIFTKITYKKGILRAFIRAFGGFFGILGILAVIFFLNTQSIVPFIRNNSEIKKLHVPFYPINSFAKALNKKLSPPAQFSDLTIDAQKISNSQKPKLLIFVLGETARSANYSALGYTGNDTNSYTKPFVDSKNAVFFDATSCGTATLVSVPCMFSHAAKSEYSDKINASNAVDFIAKTGANTFWLGNNTGNCKGVCQRISTKNLNAKYDEALLEPFSEILSSAKGDTAVFLHLQGSHGPTYFERYPKDFARFSPTCDTSDLSKCDENAIINTYDNTILYTDYLLSKIIEKISAKNEFQSLLVYMSDHGESLGEGGIYLHGLPYSIAPSVQTHVPLMLYSADKTLISNIKEGSFSHDNLFHTLLGFFGIQSKYYDEKLDIFRHN